MYSIVKYLNFSLLQYRKAGWLCIPRMIFYTQKKFIVSTSIRKRSIKVMFIDQGKKNEFEQINWILLIKTTENFINEKESSKKLFEHDSHQKKKSSISFLQERTSQHEWKERERIIGNSKFFSLLNLFCGVVMEIRNHLYPRKKNKINIFS